MPPLAELSRWASNHRSLSASIAPAPPTHTCNAEYNAMVGYTDRRTMKYLNKKQMSPKTPETQPKNNRKASGREECSTKMHAPSIQHAVIWNGNRSVQSGSTALKTAALHALTTETFGTAQKPLLDYRQPRTRRHRQCGIYY